MATLNDRQVDRFVQLGSTNATGAASALAASVTGPGTGADVLKVAYDFGSTTAAVGGNTPYGQAVGTPVTVTDPKTGITTITTMISDGRGGSFPQVTTGGSSSITTASTSMGDAFANLTMLLNEYGLGSLSDTVTRMIKLGLTPQEALVKLKYDKTIDPVTGKAWNDAYTTRFSGNTARVNAGLNAISEAAYINLEDSYAQTLKSYGLGNMLSTDRATNESMFAKYISQDISAIEFTDRIKLAEDTIVNADPAVLKTFNNFYGTLTNKDLIAYVLAPDETLPMLQTKAAAAQIGSAALGQGLDTNVASAQALALQGVTYNQAQAGYAKIGQELPIASKLSGIYNGQIQGPYDQAAAEAEQFGTAGAASAARKKQQLKELEVQQFAGRSGINPATVSQAGLYTGSLGKNIQGSF